MSKPGSIVRFVVVGLVLGIFFLAGLARAQSARVLPTVVLAPGARCGFLVECTQFDEIGLHVGTDAAVRTDSSRSYWDAQGALRLSLTLGDLAEGGVAFAGHMSSYGGSGLHLTSSPVLLFTRLRLLPLPLGRLAWAPLRLALTYQHELVADPFGQNEPPGMARGTLRVVVGQSLGRVDLDGNLGFVLAQPSTSQPRPVAFELGASASVWLWRGMDHAPADEFRLTAEVLTRFSVHPAFPSEQNLLLGFLGKSANGYGGGVAFGTQVLDRQAGLLAVARLQVSWGKQHRNPWAERKAAEPQTTPDFIWKLLGAIDPVLGTDGCVWTDPTPERSSSKWFCIGQPAPEDPSQIIVKGGKRIAAGTHLWEMGSTLRMDDGSKLIEIPLHARFRKAVWDYIDRNQREIEKNRREGHRPVCEGKVSILHGSEHDLGKASMLALDDFGGRGALLGEEFLRKIYCGPELSSEEQALMALNILSLARTRGPLRAPPPLAERLDEASVAKAPGAPAVGSRGSASASSFSRTESLKGGASSRKVDDLIEKMRRDGWKGDPIKIVEHNGQKYIIDGHHRVEAARRVGIEVQYEIASPSDLARSGYQTLDDVLHAASEAGPNRLRQ